MLKKYILLLTFFSFMNIHTLEYSDLTLELGDAFPFHKVTCIIKSQDGSSFQAIANDKYLVCGKFKDKEKYYAYVYDGVLELMVSKRFYKPWYQDLKEKFEKQNQQS